ncbi:unnamed protein product [Kluyveromyces dobzhanskii CBS 2104]|uniref:WGS project CCBQ000000000 data, contig 00058 n=1 Tax=Kluyveromyces dobzhanskii CBS 2104 TaxID=1427455 RepID=A0A0A8LBS4_9SACH|nr:unnamed protein product [Kluyveromyces dobzhanskii CBS 2104]
MNGENTALCNAVFTNLVYQQLWTETKIVDFGDVSVVCGIPSHKLTNDQNDTETEGDGQASTATEKHFVYPILMHQYKNSGLTMNTIDHVFSQLPNTLKRLTLGIVNDDGTIVYYFIYKGLRKPKKN